MHVCLCAYSRSTTWSLQPCKREIWNERFCSLQFTTWNMVIIVIWSLFKKCLTSKNYTLYFFPGHKYFFLKKTLFNTEDCSSVHKILKIYKLCFLSFHKSNEMDTLWSKDIVIMQWRRQGGRGKNWSRKKVSEYPPPPPPPAQRLFQRWRSISGMAQQWRGILPSLSKHPGAAPVIMSFSKNTQKQRYFYH